ncbi:MAG: hypothetical protein J6S82_00675 [Bacteroidales bacterium]|nr:hypothetical protein [Bacteroidales bacterium]
MKKLLFLLCLLPCCLSAQRPEPVCHSWDGDGMKPDAKIRTLNLFINIIYDVHPEQEPFSEDNGIWDRARQEGLNNEAIPSYLSDTTFLNTVYVPCRLTGCITRVFGEASFDSLQITGDFVVVNIRESRVMENQDPHSYFYYTGIVTCQEILSAAIRYMNSQGGLQTLYGHNQGWQYGFSNARKSRLMLPDDGSAFIQLFFRNLTTDFGGLAVGQGSSSSFGRDSLFMGDTLFPFYGEGTIQYVGIADLGQDPTSVVCHEIAHKLFGGNGFHTSGGNHRSSREQMPFLTLPGGYGLMGCTNSSLVGCNGYERWRMHWKHPDAPDYITARDSTDSVHVVSDISRADGNRTFRLRDFVTYGDAVRIRLPYTDSSACSNQYIWLENHKIGQNGKLDFLQHSNENACRPAGAGGIYAYYQIGRDTLSGSITTVWYDNERDNLRQIPAEGFHDYSLVKLDSGHAYNLECVNHQPHYYYHVQGAENPFNGYSDLEEQFQPDAGDDTLKKQHERPLWRKVVGRDTLDGLVNLGDNADAFSTAAHLNMGTNPSSCNAKVYYNCLYATGTSDYPYHRNNPRNVRHTWLSGLGITLEPLPDGDFLVRVRWDDYDITNDAIWTGQVMLREETNLTRGRRITLTQNRTPEQPFRDSISGEFAPVSLLRCRPGSLFRLEPKSSLFLESKSCMLLDSGSRFEMGDSTEVRIGPGSLFEVSKGADIKSGRHARIVVEKGGTLVWNGIRYRSGTYFVRYRSKNGVQTLKFVKVL